MNTKTGRRLGPALLTAAVLLLAFTGSATAKALVTGKQIKDSAVRSSHLRDATVTGNDVPTGSVHWADLGENVKLNPPVGEGGPVGTTGIVGKPGSSGIDHWFYPYSGLRAVEPGDDLLRSASCPGKTRVLSGGIVATDDPTGLQVRQSAPMTDGKGWTSLVHNSGSADIEVRGWAICVGIVDSPTPGAAGVDQPRG